MVTQLTEDQISFLRDKDIPSDRVFDATGMRPPVWQKIMSEQGRWIAYGVAPCEAKGHTLRTRKGHCVQCKPDKLSYLRRHDEAGKVYVAYSPSKKIVKVGTAQRTDRIDQLNGYQYGGARDWRKEFVVDCERAGKVESFAQQSLTKYAVAGTYFKDGHAIECKELFGCELPVAINAVKEALQLVTGATKLPLQNPPKVAQELQVPRIPKNVIRRVPGGVTGVAQFASDLRMPVGALVEQLRKAGVAKIKPDDFLTEQDKSRLLEYLRRSHAAAEAKSEISSERSTICVEARKKRILVKRDVCLTDFIGEEKASNDSQNRLAVSLRQKPTALPRPAMAAPAPTKPVAPKRHISTLPQGAIIGNSRACTCGGNNENCFKCDGRGWIDSSARSQDKLPPCRGDLGGKDNITYEMGLAIMQSVLNRTTKKSPPRGVNKNKPANVTAGKKKAKRHAGKKIEPVPKLPDAPPNFAINEAFERVINERANERENDATRDYSGIRDGGQFGSYPSHDDYDN